MLLTIIMTTLLSLTLSAMCMSHPVSITITIIFQTILMSMLISIITLNPWFSYILFLVFLGGMLVLFSYITSLTPNFSFKINNMLIMVAVPLSLIILTFLTKIKMMENYQTIKPSISMNKFFFQELNITIMLALFLLMVLLVVVQVSSSFKGPLQTKS